MSKIVEIKNIFESYNNIIGNDCFANTISLLELIIAIIALFVGGKKVSELLEEFAKRRREAIFGYYTNLNYFIKRIIALISDNNNNHLGTLYLLSIDEPLREENNGLNVLGDKLSQVANECLHYLSVQSSQIPPANTDQERINWKKKIDNLVDILNQFCFIGSKIYIPNLLNRDSVDNYYNDVKNLLCEIQTDIEKETSDFFHDIENESQN